MKRLLLAFVLLLAGCDTSATPSVAPSPAPSSAAPSAAPKPVPTFADLTQGNVTSVVKIYAFDPDNSSAIVEPIIFMNGAEYCKKFKIKSSNSRCQMEWTTERSNVKITTPVAEKPKFFTWEGKDGGVCIDTPEGGGTCPMSQTAFTRWVAEESGGMASITTENGEIVRLAQIYTP